MGKKDDFDSGKDSKELRDEVDRMDIPFKHKEVLKRNIWRAYNDFMPQLIFLITGLDIYDCPYRFQSCPPELPRLFRELKQALECMIEYYINTEWRLYKEMGLLIPEKDANKDSKNLHIFYDKKIHRLTANHDKEDYLESHGFERDNPSIEEQRAIMRRHSRTIS